MGQNFGFTINWNTSYVNAENNKVQESFKEAVYTKETTNIPLYSKTIPINYNDADVSFSNFIYEPFTGQIANQEQLSEAVQFETKIEFVKKAPYLTVYGVPLRINPLTGQVEKLLSFDVSVQGKNTFIAKKYKASKPNSILAQGTWYKIGVANDGVYKIDKSFLETNGINGTVNFSTFGVYGQAMGILPEANDQARTDDLEEIPIKINDLNNNGVWDASDFILFYAKGPNNWKYNSATQKWGHTINIYSDWAGYFITTNKGSGMQIPAVASAISPNQTASTYDFLALYEEELYNLIYTELTATFGSGREWFGKRLSNYENTESFSINVPNPVTSTQAKLQIRVAGASATNNSTFTLKNNGQNIGTIYTNSVGNGTYADVAKANFQEISTTIAQNNDFQLSFSNADFQASGYLDYVELIAKANLTANDNYLLFRNTETIGSGNITQFTANNANGNTQVWDVSSGIYIKNVQGTLSGNQFQFSAATDTLKEFALVNTTSSNFPTPTFISQVANQNLHALAQTDMFIISPPEFVSAAEELAAFHRAEGKTVVVVEPERIYNEFSSGAQDLTAIRDFLKMFYNRATNYSTMPKYVLLFGDASFDYKNRIDNFQNFVPTYESPNSFSSVSSYCT